MQRPTGIISASEITRTQWIVFRWINISTDGDAEPKYLCQGQRDIAEASEAGAQFDVWIKAVNQEMKRPIHP